MADLNPFATVAELAAYWRTLTDQEEKRANSLLPLASNRLRSMAAGYSINLDTKAAADPLFKSNLNYVVLEAVKRALQTPQDTPPVDTYQRGAGPYSENYKFTNPSGDLWFKKSELAELGFSGTQTISSITPMTRGNIYGENNTEETA